MRNTKVMVVGCGTVLVVTLATAVGTAFATEFKAAEYPVRVEASQVETTQFKIGSSPSVECTTVRLRNAEPEFLSGTSETLLMAATYSGCTAFGFVSAEVSMGGCLYLLMQGGTINIKGHVAEPAACSKAPIRISISSVGCEITIGEQELTSADSFANVSRKIETTFHVKKIKYTSNEKGIGCPKNSQEAEFVGKSLASGFNELGESDALEVK